MAQIETRADIMGMFVVSVGVGPTDEFAIESLTAEVVKVRHGAHRHRFTFRVLIQPSGLRILRGGPIQENEATNVPAMLLRRRARAFAEREARKAGLID
jgi:hypothetical protein